MGTWRYHGRKVGTRRAQAISKVSLAAAALVESGRIRDVRLAFASVAPVPLRCIATERAVVQLPAEARQTLAGEIAPINDIRSTAEYRSRVAQNLLEEFLETLR